MKKILNLLFIAALGTFTLTSCGDDEDFDQTAYIEANKKAERTLDSLFSAEKLKIESYVGAQFTTPVEDTVTYSFQYLEKKIKRGIWYEIVTPATDETYEYKAQLVNSYYGSYFVAALPKVKLKYTAKLLDGTVVQSETVGTDFDLSAMRTGGTSNIFNSAWEIAFSPYSLKYNGETKVLNGLTAKGLNKGTKVRVITPSPWAFYNKAIEKSTTTIERIPAYSPIVYEFEILTIE